MYIYVYMYNTCEIKILIFQGPGKKETRRCLWKKSLATIWFWYALWKQAQDFLFIKLSLVKFPLTIPADSGPAAVLFSSRQEVWWFSALQKNNRIETWGNNSKAAQFINKYKQKIDDILNNQKRMLMSLEECLTQSNKPLTDIKYLPEEMKSNFSIPNTVSINSTEVASDIPHAEQRNQLINTTATIFDHAH